MKTKFIKYISALPLIVVAPTVSACKGNSGSGKSQDKFPYVELENPTLKIETENKKKITSKEEYIPATFTLANCDESQKLNAVTGNIRGRGNVSWAWAKKSYSIKFDEKTSVLGSNYKAKKWAIIANYVDNTLSRNVIAYELTSNLNNIIWQPKTHQVDVYLNDKYIGVYMMVDRIEVSKNRINIDESIDTENADNGYLLEQTSIGRAEGTEDVDYIKFNNSLVFEIKSPDTESEEYLPYAKKESAFIKSYVQSCFDALDSGVWANVDAKMNVDSFVDGYLVEELFSNLDCYRFSMYYYKDKGGKLSHGPVWDFDLSSGNCNGGPGETTEFKPDKRLWAAETNIFYKGLFQYPEFKQKVAARLTNFKSKFNEIVEKLNPENEQGYYLTQKQSIDRNFKKWKTLGVNATSLQPNKIVSLRTVPEQLTYLHDWLITRYNYMQEQIK